MSCSSSSSAPLNSKRARATGSVISHTSSTSVDPGINCEPQYGQTIGLSYLPSQLSGAPQFGQLSCFQLTDIAVHFQSLKKTIAELTVVFARCTTGRRRVCLRPTGRGLNCERLLPPGLDAGSSRWMWLEKDP